MSTFTGSLTAKRRVVAAVRRDVGEWLRVMGHLFNYDAESELDVAASCLPHAYFTLKHLRRLGLDAIIQAGSASWPRILPEQDDGVCPTHFSYVFEAGHPETLRRLRAHSCPEMHAWVGVRGRGEVVDLTSRYFPVMCRKVIGMDWPGAPPPDFLWTSMRRLPAGVVYRADATANTVACRLLEAMFR